MLNRRGFKQITAGLAAVLALVSAAPALADPPPWAPAHGWRKKHDPAYVGYTGRKWDRDYGVIAGKCNTGAVLAAVGGVIGGVAGSQVGQGDGRTVAIIVGTAIGAILGAKIGRELDRADQACIGHSLELVGDGRRVVWTNVTTGVNYELTPLRGDGKSCRAFRLVASHGGKRDESTRTACRSGDGHWALR